MMNIPHAVPLSVTQPWHEGWWYLI